MTQPYFMSPFDSDGVYVDRDYLGLITGALALSVGVIGLIFVRHKVLLATGLLSGFVWTLPLRNWSALHDFQALFYIGIPLAAFALIMLYIRRLSGPQLAAAFAVAALAAFVASAAEMADVGHGHTAKAEKAVMQDFAVIRNLVNNTNGVVYVAARHADYDPFGAPLAPDYFLAGKVLLFAGSTFATPLTSQFPERRVWADYVVTPRRESGPALLTPDNRRFFLYDRAIYDGQYDAANLGRPIIAAGDWEVYFKYNSLIYVSEECANTDAAFLLHLLPRDISELPERSIEYGFENRDFFFADYDIGRRNDGRCVAVRDLSQYEVAAISTGQYTDTGRLLWRTEYHFE